MQSEHLTETYRPSPLRAAALRPEGTEFKVAGSDYGGARQKAPSSEPIVDDKGIPLPLDKAVAEEITAGHKDEEAINHQNQELERNVRVGLKQVAKDSGVPTTVFSSMGGSRSSASTVVDFGGAGGKKAGGDNLPKEFEYREEDFMPLSQSASDKHGPSQMSKSGPSGSKDPSQSIKATSAQESSRHHNLNSAFFQQPHSHKSNAVDSPELNLGTYSPEESASKKSTHKPTFNTSRPAFKAPAHIANKPKSKHVPHQTTPHHREEAHTPSSSQQQLHAKSKASVESMDDDGPAPQLHSLSQQFFAKSSSDSNAPSTAHHSTAAPIHYSAMPPVHHNPPAHHSAPEHHFVADHITPLHRVDPPVHHTASTHASTEVSSDPMHRAHAAPIYHAPSITGQHLPPVHHDGPSRRAPTQIETIHMPHHAPVHAPAHAPTEHHTHIETIHAAYHPEEAPKKKRAPYVVEVPDEDVERAASHLPSRAVPHARAAIPTSAPAPVHEVPSHYPVATLGKSHDEPVKSKSNDLAPVKSQTDGAGLNAASFPSFVRSDASAPGHAHHAAESNHKAAAVYKGPIHAAVLYHTPPPELHPNVTHAHAQQMPTHTYKPNKRSKRSRKAAKKQEVARSLGVLGSISEALVGRRKNTVSTPVMRLNEIFGEAEGPITHDAPIHAQGVAHGANIVAPAAAVAAGLDGIRHLLGAIHMPAIIARHPSDNAHEDWQKLASDSAHDTHVAGHMQHKHTPSKAVALKTPKANLLLFPEEDASYPRGDVSKHENPAHPKSIVDVTEIHYQLPSHVSAHVPVQSARVPAAFIQAPAVHTHATPASPHRAPLGHMHLDLHTHQVPNPAVSAQSAHGVGVVHNIHPQHKHSYAAALKKPKAKLNAFPEEQADYPRGDKHRENKPSRPLHSPLEVHEVQLPAATSYNALHQRKNSKAAALKKASVPVDAFPEEEATYPRGDVKHHENTPSQPMHKPIVVQEVQLDAAHLHSHHDLHPTMGESAAAAVSHGLENIKAMLGGIHLSNPEAQATIASLGAASVAASHREGHKLHHQGANLPLMYGTPVHAASAHASTKPANVEHHDPYVTHTAAAAPLAHGSHMAPAVVPVYIAEPVVQVHDQDPLQHTHVPVHTPARASAPVKAAASASTSQRNLPPAEHRSRGMDIRGSTDDDENYFSADDIKSPENTGASKLKLSGGDISVLKHDAPVSVLPPGDNVIKASSVYGAAPVQHTSRSAAPLVAAAAAIPIAGAHPIAKPPVERARDISVLKHDAPVSVLPPGDNAFKASSVHGTAPVQHTSHSAAPLVAAAAAIPITGAIHHTEDREHKAAPVSAARIPIARPPVERAIPIKKTIPTQSPAAPAFQHTPSAPVAPTQAHHAAAPLMGAAAASVKPDEVILMESAMPKYKEAPKPDHDHYIPTSAVAPVIPIKTASAQAPHVLGSVPAPLVAKPKDDLSAAKHKSATSDMSHKLSHVAAPAAATVATAAVVHNARNNDDVPVQTTRTIKPELKLHESDVTKPTPLNAAHPVIPVPTENEHHSSAAKVANAHRPIIPQEDIKTTATSTNYNDPVANPVEVKVAKPVVETAKPVVAAQAVKHEAPVATKSTHTASIPVAVPTIEHEKSTVTSNTKPAPVPAVRPVVTAAVAAPVAAAAVHHHHTAAPLEAQTARTTVTNTEIPSDSSAQQIQQQYQQSHQTTAASSSNARDVDMPMQASSLTQQTTTAPSSSNTVIPPPGYSGAIPAVNEGESVIWVKKVYTTQDFYDSEDEDEIDELGHRKDRDVSRYMPGVHLPHSNNTNNVSHIVGNTAQIQPQMQTDTTHVLPQVQTNAQYQHPMQPQSNLAPPQAQTASNAQSQSQMTNAQFQQHLQANNANAQTLAPPQDNQAQARRQSQPQVHPNNPETRRQSQATFQQHLKEYRRRSSSGNATSPGKNENMDNNQQRQAAQ